MAHHLPGSDSERFTALLFSRMKLASPEADQLEQLALTVPAWAEALTRAEVLSEPTWAALWDRFSGRSELAQALALRPLTADQIDRVCASTPKSRVVSALLRHNRSLSAAQLTSLAAGAKASVAKALVDSILDGSVPLGPDTGQVALTLARTAGPARWVRLVAFGGELFDAAERSEVLDALRGGDLRTPSASWDVQLLLWRHRDLLDHCVAAERDAWLDVRIAGLPVPLTLDQQLRIADLGELEERPELSPVLARRVLERRFVLMALVNNPVCRPELVQHVSAVVEVWLSAPEASPHAEPELWSFLSELLRSCRSRSQSPHKAPAVVSYATVTEPERLAWLVRRVCPSEFRARPRPLEALELSYNPHLGPSDAARLARVFADPDVRVLIGEELARGRFEQLAGMTEEPMSWYEPWQGQLSEPERRRVAAGQFDDVGSTTLYRLLQAADSDYDLQCWTRSGASVALVDWFLVELLARVGNDATSFAAAAGLVTVLDPDTPLSELLELAGAV
jgi:hypothetical protein